MKTTAIALIALSLTVGAASAAERFTDVDYLKAARCKGIAAGFGVDTAAVNKLLKKESQSRVDYLQQKAEQEFNQAKRDTQREVLKPQLTAELSGACAGYMGGKTSVAAGAVNNPT